MQSEVVGQRFAVVVLAALRTNVACGHGFKMKVGSRLRMPAQNDYTGIIPK